MTTSLKIGVIGFPGLYGGAGTELDNQLTLWHGMGYDVHVVPTHDPTNEPLLKRTQSKATVHSPLDYNAIKGMDTISFCNDAFLRDIKIIKAIAKRTMFVNCMTWLFNAEKDAHKQGLIDLFLYQNIATKNKVDPVLKKINSKFNWKVVRSWFDDSSFPFYSNRMRDKFRFGRISREDADKYAVDTIWVYDTMVSPVPKSGIILGYDERSEKKIGKPPDWIRTYPGSGISQAEFYAHSSCVIQKSDTFENWPRIGFEAMASGSILIVDDRGAWKSMVEHGVTGWVCKDARDFAYYSSRMAYEPDERDKMAINAANKYLSMNDKISCEDSWREVFDD